MDYFFALLIVYTLIFLYALFVFNGKVLSPSIIFSASFTCMVYLAYITKDAMGFEVSKNTFNVLSMGGVLFILSETVIWGYYNIIRFKKNRSIVSTGTPKPLVIKRQILNIFFTLVLFSFALALVSIVLSTSGSAGNRMEVYRNMMIQNDENVRYRFALNQLFKINTALSYVCAYLVVYNCSVCKQKLIKQLKYLLIVLVYIVYTIFSQGARQPAIEIIVFMFIMYFAWNLKRREKKKLFKSIAILGCCAPVVAFVFTKTAEFVGRRVAERHVLTYISTYFCGGLYAFNLHVNEPARNYVWGQSSFADIYQFLNKLNIVPDSWVASYHSFELYGNTVTMFGRWYEDFGTIGVCIMTVLVASFFSILFYKYIYPTPKSQNLHLSKIVYGKLVIALVWAGYDDRIRALFSVTNVLYLVFIVMIFKFFVERHYHFTFGRKI
ncbi:MAG: O-antigen polymerase [Roseburia sp.]